VAEVRDVSVVIPAFNEEDAVAKVVEGLRAGGPWGEVLVVDDGSKDRTAERAEAAGARVVRHPYNKGNGVVLFMDADGQHDPEEALRLVEGVGVYDMVIGSRSARDQAPTRALGNAIFKSLASWLTGREIPDLTSGFRAASRERMLEILHLLPNRFSYPTTSCLAFLKAGLNVGFVPVKARARVGVSKIRAARDGVRFVLIIFKIVTLYSPLKVFFPISAAALLLGLAYGAWNVHLHGKIPMGSALLIQLAVVVFLFGLISEQIAAAQERK
jgi:glycosyltransferase involved in cell wall biosynthesis